MAGLHYVNDTWDNTTPAWFKYDENDVSSVPVIQLNNPAPDHKRAYEDSATGRIHYLGWFIVENVLLNGNRIDVNGRFGAFNNSDIKANFVFVVGDPSLFNTNSVPDVPYILFRWRLSDLGYSNGSYNIPVSGYIILNSTPSYSFSPANPYKIEYNRITELPNRNVSVLFGYWDPWAADNNQWASARRDSYIKLGDPVVIPSVSTLSASGIGLD